MPWYYWLAGTAAAVAALTAVLGWVIAHAPEMDFDD